MIGNKELKVQNISPLVSHFFTFCICIQTWAKRSPCCNYDYGLWMVIQKTSRNSCGSCEMRRNERKRKTKSII